MVEISVRELRLADRERWAELRHALWPDATLADLRDEVEGMLDGDFAGFGAFAGSELVGFAEVSQRAYGDGCDTAPVAWLEGVYALPAFRRAHVGRVLLAAVEDWARARGLTELGSDAEIGNLVSRLSHARWGFEETERVVMLRKHLR